MSTSFGIRLRFKLWLCYSLLQIHFSEQWFHLKLKDDNSTFFSLVKHIVRVCMLNCVQLFNSMDCSPPGSSVHGILQARILEWIAISFSRGSSQPRNGTLIPALVGRFFITKSPGKPKTHSNSAYLMKLLSGSNEPSRMAGTYYQLTDDCLHIIIALTHIKMPIFIFHLHYYKEWCFPCSSVGKESACNTGDLGSISGSGRSPGERNGNHSSIFVWRIPWTEEPGRLQSMGFHESDMS